MMQITPLAIPDVLLIEPRRHGDARGFFSETYSRNALAAAGFDREFVQDNHSLSPKRGTLRGLHFQTPPHSQDKLLRVTRGAMLDVAVDIRRGSPTFGQHVAIELSAENWRQLLVPKGFAHGFVSLSDDAAVTYQVSAFYTPESEGGARWYDPAFDIEWPVPVVDMSVKDRHWPDYQKVAK